MDSRENVAVLAKYLNNEELISFIFPDKEQKNEKKEAPDSFVAAQLKRALLKRLDEEEGSLVRLNKSKQQILDEKKLEQLLRRSDLVCSIVMEKVSSDRGLLIGYRIYKKAGSIITSDFLDTGISCAVVEEKVGGEKNKDDVMISKLLNLAMTSGKAEGVTSSGRISIERSRVSNCSAEMRDSLYNFALHVNSSTSFWLGWFSGNRKGAELKRIAKEIKDATFMGEKEIKGYLLDIAYAAVQTRRSSLYLSRKATTGQDEKGRDKVEEIMAPTNSGHAFMLGIYGVNARYSGLRRFLPLSELKGVKQNAGEEPIDTLHRNIIHKVGLEIKQVKKDDLQKKDGPREVKSGQSNPYRRRS